QPSPRSSLFPYTTLFRSSTVLPTPAPFPYAESASSIPAAQERDSRLESPRRPITAKAVREAAFKYNGVPDFCEFLSALPADVSRSEEHTSELQSRSDLVC